jgi:phosphotriesterase-related protein
MSDLAKVMTVRGPIPAGEIGLTLTHEHVMVDFVGADRVSRARYRADEVFAVMLPFLRAAKDRGVATFVDATPMFLGRDPKLLQRLSEATGLRILTNTGLYKEPYLPPYAFTETAEQLAARWTREWEDGIEGTGIRPGFIKVAVNPGKPVAVQQNILRAAALTSRRTGLTVGSHTAHGEAATESLALLRAAELPLRKFIVIHADAIPDRAVHQQIAAAGAWVSFDGVGGRPVAEHVAMIQALLAGGHANRLLLSHDAGWYNVGEPGGGKQRAYTALTDELLPALRAAGVPEATIRQLTIANPGQAFAVG